MSDPSKFLGKLVFLKDEEKMKSQIQTSISNCEFDDYSCLYSNLDLTSPYKVEGRILNLVFGIILFLVASVVIVAASYHHDKRAQKTRVNFDTWVSQGENSQKSDSAHLVNLQKDLSFGLFWSGFIVGTVRNMVPVDLRMQVFQYEEDNSFISNVLRAEINRYVRFVVIDGIIFLGGITFFLSYMKNIKTENENANKPGSNFRELTSLTSGKTWYIIPGIASGAVLGVLFRKLMNETYIDEDLKNSDSSLYKFYNTLKYGRKVISVLFLGSLCYAVIYYILYFQDITKVKDGGHMGSDSDQEDRRNTRLIIAGVVTLVFTIILSVYSFNKEAILEHARKRGSRNGFELDKKVIQERKERNEELKKVRQEIRNEEEKNKFENEKKKLQAIKNKLIEKGFQDEQKSIENAMSAEQKKKQLNIINSLEKVLGKKEDNTEQYLNDAYMQEAFDKSKIGKAYLDLIKEFTANATAMANAEKKIEDKYVTSLIMGSMFANDKTIKDLKSLKKSFYSDVKSLLDQGQLDSKFYSYQGSSQPTEFMRGIIRFILYFDDAKILKIEWNSLLDTFLEKLQNNNLNYDTEYDFVEKLSDYYELWMDLPSRNELKTRWKAFKDHPLIQTHFADLFESTHERNDVTFRGATIPWVQFRGIEDITHQKLINIIFLMYEILTYKPSQIDNKYLKDLERRQNILKFMVPTKDSLLYKVKQLPTQDKHRQDGNEGKKKNYPTFEFDDNQKKYVLRNSSGGVVQNIDNIDNYLITAEHFQNEMEKTIFISSLAKLRKKFDTFLPSLDDERKRVLKTILDAFTQKKDDALNILSKHNQILLPVLTLKGKDMVDAWNDMNDIEKAQVGFMSPEIILSVVVAWTVILGVGVSLGPFILAGKRIMKKLSGRKTGEQSKQDKKTSHNFKELFTTLSNLVSKIRELKNSASEKPENVKKYVNGISIASGANGAGGAGGAGGGKGVGKGGREGGGKGGAGGTSSEDEDGEGGEGDGNHVEEQLRGSLDEINKTSVSDTNKLETLFQSLCDQFPIPQVCRQK